MRLRLLLALFCTIFGLAKVLPAQDEETEIVANLAAGRVIIHVTRDAIVFGAIDHPLEAKSVPPRVAEIDHSHVGVFFGASEWQLSASPKAIRLDHDITAIYAPNPHYAGPSDSGESDLEQMGLGMLEKLRPLVSQLHHKIDLGPDEPILEIVLIGYGPRGYGPEVWLMDYRVEQTQVSSRENYLSTRPLRPRFTQIYPPGKHDPHVPVEVRYPASEQDVPMLGLIQQNDPRIAKLRGDARFAKVIDLIDHGQANKAVTQDAEDFMRALLPMLAGNRSFVQATIGEDAGFKWVVPPSEPVDKKQKAAEDKDRPPDAPTLRRRPDPN